MDETHMDQARELDRLKDEQERAVHV